MIPAGLKFGWAAIPSWAKWLGGVLLLLGVVYLLIDAHGDSRYREGQATEKAAWEAAEARLREKAVEAGAEATRAEIVRQREREAIVEQERERINEAIERGDSPFDVMDGFTNAVGGGLH